jgi:ABC-type multidrug transport system fused ATPase/permease subunit
LYFAAALLIACGSLASFFYGYTLQPAVSCFSLKLQAPLRYLWYVSLLFANFFGVKGVDRTPILIGCLVTLWLVWTLVAAVRNALSSATPSRIQNAVSATLVGYSLLFSMNTAIGRLCLGLESAQSSRYTNYLALGIFGAYLHLLSFQTPKLRRALLGVALLALFATVPIGTVDRGVMKGFSEMKRNWRRCYLAGSSIPACDAVAGTKIAAEPEQDLQHQLDYLKQRRKNLYSDSNEY